MNRTYDLLLLDCMNHAHRSWWRRRDSTTVDGRDNGIERGFMEGLVELLQLYPEAQLVLARDGEPVGQRAALTGYKAGRAERHKDRPSDWHPRCDALVTALGRVFPTLYDPADEADREIGRMVRHISGDARTLVVSTDGDLLMLLSPRVHALRPGHKLEFYKPEDFRAEYGFEPERLVLYRSLVGDRSDEIPGLPHFPRKAARRLAAAFGTVDALYRVLTGPARSPELELLTEDQRRKLRDGESRVRSNARLIDLVSADGPPHLSLPSGDLAPLRELLGGRGLVHLAASLDWASLTGISAVGGSVRSVLERISARGATAPGPVAQTPGSARDGRGDALALNRSSSGQEWEYL